MEYTKLGQSDLRVSKLCLGCMSFGDSNTNFMKWTLDKYKSEEIIKRALELGINFFDTSNNYSAGTSEEYLGRALRNHASRADVVIASKVFFNDGRLSAAAINREIEGTLKRLGTDYLDLYIIHRFDYKTPIAETLDALDTLVKAGKVRAIGASAMYASQFREMLEYQETNGLARFVNMQNHYKLLYREEEREMISLCEEYSIARTSYSPLAAGRLARGDWAGDTLRFATDKNAAGKYDGTLTDDTEIARRVKELSDKYGASMTAIALSWQFKRGVTAPIIGATKPEYLTDAATAFDIELSDADAQYLEEPYKPHKLTSVLNPE